MSVDIRTGRTRCAIALPSQATPPATSGTPASNAPAVSHGNAGTTRSTDLITIAVGR